MGVWARLTPMVTHTTELYIWLVVAKSHDYNPALWLVLRATPFNSEGTTTDVNLCPNKDWPPGHSIGSS